MDQVQPQDTTKQNEKDYNFAKLRESLEQAKQEIAQLKQMSSAPVNNYDDDSSDEPYVDQKRFKKTLEEVKKEIRKESREEAVSIARELLNEERKTHYLKSNADFNATMSPEILQKFEDSHPKIAESILKMPEGFERQKLVYESIKALGVDRPQAKEPSVQDRIEANRRSPYYQGGGTGSAPYESTGDFSPAGQKGAYEKMQELKARIAR